MKDQTALHPDDPYLTDGWLAMTTGWEHAVRLFAATEAIGAMYWSLSADTASERYSDELDVWHALQDWLRVSPWWDTFGFVILRKPGGMFDFSYALAPVQ